MSLKYASTMSLKYALGNPLGKIVARAEEPTLLVDAAAARAVVAERFHGRDAEWRVYLDDPKAGPRRLLYGISVAYGVYEIDGSKVPSTVSRTLDGWLGRPSLPPLRIPADSTGYSPEDPKHPIWQDGVPS